MAQGTCSLPPRWATWIEFLAPGFDLEQVWLLKAFGE